jgi:AraC-like DNA-binding protein
MFGSASMSGSLASLLLRYCHRYGLTTPSQAHRYSPQDRIPMVEFLEMLAFIQAQRPDVQLGLELGAHAQISDTGVLGYLSLSCDTMWEMMLRFMRYHRLAYDANDMEINFLDDALEISWGTERFEPTLLQDETLLALFVTILRQLTAIDHVRLLSLDVLHQVSVEVAAQYQAFFDCPIRFGADKTRLYLPLHALNASFNHADPQLILRLEQQAEALMNALPPVDTFDDELRQVLIRCLHNGEPGLEQVAEAMNLSVRSLQRRLAEQQQTFQNVLARTRLALARQYLQDPNLSLSDIAFLLGYSEQSAFQRAFKQWTGQTPHQLRQTEFKMPSMVLDQD